MKKLLELKTGTTAEELRSWYIYAKKYFDLLVRNDPIRRQHLLDAIAEYEKNNEIR